MKGVTDSIFNYLVIALSLIFLSIFFISQGALRGGEVSESVNIRSFDEEGVMVLLSLFHNEIDLVEKPYAMALVDATLKMVALNDSSAHTKVDYGSGVGTLNNTEIIPGLFDNYIPDRWRLEVVVPNGTLIYGNFFGEAKYVYRQLVPVPEQRTGTINLYIG